MMKPLFSMVFHELLKTVNSVEIVPTADLLVTTAGHLSKCSSLEQMRLLTSVEGTICEVVICTEILKIIALKLQYRIPTRINFLKNILGKIFNMFRRKTFEYRIFKTSKTTVSRVSMHQDASRLLTNP